MPTPVYLFTGFLDSGKTTLIKDTLNDPQFMEGVQRTLILTFEEGEEEYDDKFLEEHNAFLEKYDDPEVLTETKCRELDTIYHPSQVFIEWNGSTPIGENLLQNMPDFWPLVEILSTVDASTFANYVQNMRQMIYEQLKYSDVVICNRCTPDTSGTLLRGNIKAMNKRAQIFYEGAFGEPVELKSGTLPFDINADVVDIKDDDYGLWYMDCSEDPSKYDNKEMILRGQYAQNIPDHKQSFVLGRRAMVCCEADTSLCGVTVTGVRIQEMNLGDWVEVKGKMRTVDLENGGKTVVMYADAIRHYHEPEEPYVYFS
ncbi:MAG: GTP-binding protein [Bulleidia sp.]|nr:GTP-binding protein [Bulleidia sp.]